MKIFIRLLLVVLVLTFISAFPQEPDITWSKFYRPVSILGIETIAAAYDGHKLPDGGLISVGVCLNPYLMAYLVRTNSNGDTLWTKQHFTDVVSYGSFTGTDVERTNDGGFFITGYGTREMTAGIWILRVDSNGDSLWSRYYTGGNTDTVFVTRDMKITPDNGIIIFGYLAAGITYDDDLFVMKYSSTGTLEWYKKFGSIDVTDISISIENAIGGGYVFISDYDSAGIAYLQITKITDLGNFEWCHIYNATPEYGDEWGEIRKTNDNHYVICGEDVGDFYLMKITATGDIVWYHTYGFETYEESAMSVYQTSDNGFIICGNKTPDYDTDHIIYVVKTDENGQELWSKLIDFNTFGCAVEKIEQTNDGGYVMFGQARLEDGGADYLLLLKLGGVTDVETELTNPTEFKLKQNYPNPFNPSTKISWQAPVGSWQTLKVYDILGNEVTTLVNEEKSAGSYEVNFDAKNLSSGIYFYKIQAGNFVDTKKMIFIK